MGFRAITAQLILRTPLHVGTGNATDAVDDLLRRDAQGRILIPGTSLAGPLRAIATRLAPRLGSDLCQALKDHPNQDNPPACKCLTCQLFGDVNPREESAEGVASWVIVYDATLATEEETVIRDGVGIDRVTGAAARKERLKFDVEVLSAGATFLMRLELDSRLASTKALQLLAASLAEWEAGRGVVGGRVGRGLGAFDLKNIQFQEQTLDTVDSLTKFLKSGPDWSGKNGVAGWLTSEVVKARSTVRPWQGTDTLLVARSWVLAEFTLAADGPFLINDPVRAGQGGFDHAPLLAAYAQNGEPVLPGSSLRGVLRSQAERIARTLATQTAWKAGNRTNLERQKAFWASCPACNPLTESVRDEVASCNSFIRGKMSSQERRNLDKTGADEKLCLACRLFGSTWNGSRLRVEDSVMRPGTGKRKVMDFLAIDRFTGGGRDGAKFDAVVLWKPQFKVRLFLENPEGWELGWLALALRDLHEGLTTVGFGAAKGFGRMTIQSPSLTFGILHDTDLPILASNSAMSQAGQRLLEKKDIVSGIYQTLKYNDTQKPDWLALANGWVQEFHTAVHDKPRHKEFIMENDSYFTKKAGQWLPDLYPVEESL